MHIDFAASLAEALAHLSPGGAYIPYFFASRTVPALV